MWFPGPEPTYQVTSALTTSDSNVMNPNNPAVTSKHTITIEGNLFFMSTLLGLELLLLHILFWILIHVSIFNPEKGRNIKCMSVRTVGGILKRMTNRKI